MDKPSLLILDDEKEVLNALNRVLRKHFQLYLFSDANEAIGFYRDNPNIPLILTDMRMPVMDGATFLGKIIEINGQCKRFLLTGHADINLTVTAVNEGKISHYFSKPWDNEELIAELKNAYELFINERKTKQLLKVNLAKNAELSLINSSLELETNKTQQKLQLISTREANSFGRLKKTFSTFIDIYAETICLHTQDVTRHNFRVAAHARLIAEKQGCNKLTIFQIYIAGLLYETGKLALEQCLLNKSVETMSQQEKNLYGVFYQKSYELLNKVDELSFVAEIIKNIPASYNGNTAPEHLAAEEIPLGSRIIAIVSMYDNLVNGRQTQLKTPTVEAKHRIKELAKTMFDPSLVNQYLTVLAEQPSSKEGKVDYLLNSSDLREGMTLTRDIVNTDKNPMLTKGTEVEQHHIDKLIKIEKDQGEFFLIYAC
ncbi:HD domain-containing phosphohydrolase [Colwellia psychrerythraea]|uniref:Response regulator receiver protein n=1 Tax=Colwellia psychrerythraea TaxID=28229 RepID=A0A099K8G1_COLPS|nr:HD domain-containing phosphohydrolase [Colwellia psychrerythraea]KGJ86565.1 response regulator receiver protein [Colwellia psychrerythraea]